MSTVGEEVLDRVIYYKIVKTRDGRYGVKFGTVKGDSYMGENCSVNNPTGMKLFETPEEAKETFIGNRNNPYDIIGAHPLTRYNESEYRTVKFRNGMFTLQIKTKGFWAFTVTGKKHMWSFNIDEAEFFSTAEEVRKLYISLVQNPLDIVETVESV